MIQRFLTNLTRIGAAVTIGFASLHALADDAASLRAKHSELREQLRNNKRSIPTWIYSMRRPASRSSGASRPGSTPLSVIRANSAKWTGRPTWR